MFKDSIANDIEKVFLNPFEFADTVFIDGKEIKVVVDNDAKTYGSSVEEMDRSVGNILIFVNKETWKSTYGKIPKAFDAMQFNNIPCTVVRAVERNGVLTLTLDYGG